LNDELIHRGSEEAFIKLGQQAVLFFKFREKNVEPFPTGKDRLPLFGKFAESAELLFVFSRP
jgi:hypothetical protein